MSSVSNDSDDSFPLSPNETYDSEDGLNGSVSKILDLPRSPVVSETFGMSCPPPSGSPTQELVSTRAISPPSTVVTTSRPNGYHTNGMIPDPTYQELCEQLITLGVGPSSPPDYPSSPLNHLRSPSPTAHNGGQLSCCVHACVCVCVCVCVVYVRLCICHVRIYIFSHEVDPSIANNQLGSCSGITCIRWGAFTCVDIIDLLLPPTGCVHGSGYGPLQEA